MQAISYNAADIGCTAPEDTASDRRRRPCRACGSVDTVRDALLLNRPSVLYVITFGWVYLLVRGAFAVRTARCMHCGALNRYKTAGSWIAMAVLLFLVLCHVAVLTLEN
jgi:hypothetical protein